MAISVSALLLLSAAVLLSGTKESEAGYASIVLDADTGEVLRSRNADTRNYPASLTKMMTLYLLFEEIDSGRMRLNQKLTVSKRAAGQPASKLGLKRGATISVRQAIMALATKSANDVATVIAEAIGGSEWEFAAAMTNRARSLGMRRTRFRNASGLPNRKQLSSARDMGVLAMAILRDFPHYYDYFSAETFTYQGKTHRTHNNLLNRYPGMDGMKTGYIRASGFNLVASAVRDGKRVIAVVFGGRTAKSRDSHMVKLLDIGFARMAERDVHRGERQFAVLNSRNIPIPVFKPGVKLQVVSGIPLPTRPRPNIGQWAIQIGAYRSVVAAEVALREASRRLPVLLDRASAALTPVEMKRGDVLYRARFLGLDKGDATKACRSLKAVTMPCAVMPNPDYRLAQSKAS
ncbi:MAG: D-alanyl-D-alanine carboxypeptidase [Rhodospirillaceae bacterium]|nr:D-alanyl-D-alanine carboxypeptidase [Rhodospirillaceae bacterium]MBT6829238.1 D-alanyl-D-alanine carboxypeptidase [Rhodospirillaceae bacterium]MBT7290898.1 D-alanyl-D-alanine carboxypeptidase [Rhodospirillaceae bacterium]